MSAEALAIAFNDLQATDAGGAGLPSGAFEGQSTAALFARQFGGETVPAGEGEDAALATLAAAGLTFVPGAAPDENDELRVNLPVLQAAFERDPDGTATVLSNTAAVFGTLAGIAPEAEASIESPLSAPVAQQAADLPTPEDAFLQALLSENSSVIAAPADDTDAVVPAPVKPLPAATIDDEPVAAATRAPAAPSDGAGIEALVDAAPVPAPPVAPPVSSLAIDQEVEVEVNKALAEQAALATRTAATASDERTERLAVEVRAALSAAGEARELAQDKQARAESKALEQRRQQQALTPDDTALDSTAVVPATVTRSVPVRPVPQAEEAVPVARPVPSPAPLDRAQQAARDPAIAAAIAAYSLSTGPFAALNVRQEIAAPRVKIVPAVSTVDKVDAIDADSTAKGGTKEFR